MIVLKPGMCSSLAPVRSFILLVRARKLIGEQNQRLEAGVKPHIQSLDQSPRARLHSHKSSIISSKRPNCLFKLPSQNTSLFILSLQHEIWERCILWKLYLFIWNYSITTFAISTPSWTSSTLPGWPSQSVQRTMVTYLSGFLHS